MPQHKVENLPDDDHVMRHVPWAKLRKDANDNVLGFLPQAFALRPEEDALSASWVEFYEHAPDRTKAAIWAMRQQRHIGSKSAFGVAEVRNIKQTCASAAGVRIRVVHEPVAGWPAHSAIRRLPRDNLDLLEALATEAFTEMVLNEKVEPEAC